MTTQEPTTNFENSFADSTPDSAQHSPKSVLRVVPPTAKPAAKPPSKPSQYKLTPNSSLPAPLPVSKAPSRPPYKLLAILAVISLGFLPTRYEVGGAVTLTVNSQNRQLVTSPIDGIIKEINPNLQPGSKVKIGDKIAVIRSRPLETELSRVQQELNQAKEQLQQQIRKQIDISSQINTITAEQAALEEEREIKRSLAVGDRSSRMQVITSQITSSQAQLFAVEKDLRRIEPLEQEQAIPQAEVSRMRRERDKLLGDIATATKEQEALQQSYGDDSEKLKIAAQTKNKIALAQQPVLIAQQDVQLLQDQIKILEQRAKTLQSDRQGLTLLANIDGEITQAEAIPKVGQELKQGQSLGEIIDRQGTMTGVVEVDEHDNIYISLGQPFRFRPTQNKLRIYKGAIKSKDPTAKPTDPTGQKKVVRVAIEVQNQDGELRDGSTGYARIYSEDMNWYQRIWRELEKIISFERI